MFLICSYGGKVPDDRSAERLPPAVRSRPPLGALPLESLPAPASRLRRAAIVGKESVSRERPAPARRPPKIGPRPLASGRARRREGRSKMSSQRVEKIQDSGAEMAARALDSEGGETLAFSRRRASRACPCGGGCEAHGMAATSPAKDARNGPHGNRPVAPRRGKGRGIAQSRCNPLKRLISEKEMKGNERSFAASRTSFSQPAASRIGFENPDTPMGSAPPGSRARANPCAARPRGASPPGSTTPRRRRPRGRG